MTRADQSRNLSDSPSANPLSRPLTQEDIPNIVQQVLPNIVQQVLATLQLPESTRVGTENGHCHQVIRPPAIRQQDRTEHCF